MADSIETGPGQVERDTKDLGDVRAAFQSGAVPGAIRALERYVNRVNAALAGLEGRVDDLAEKVERHRRVLESKIARDAGIPASTADLDQRDRGPIRFPIPPVLPGRPQPRTGVPEDFLTPPPLARMIGEGIREAANVKAEAGATLGARLANLLVRLEGKDFDHLRSTIADAKRAGVIP